MSVNSPVEESSCHSTTNLLASSPESGIPQSSPHTHFSFQPKSPVITSQPTAPSLFLSVLVAFLTPFSQPVLALLHAQETQHLYEILLASGTESYTSNYLSSFTTFLSLSPIITNKLKKSRQTIPNKSYAIERI